MAGLCHVFDRLKVLFKDGQTFFVGGVHGTHGAEAGGTCTTEIEHVYLISKEQSMFCNIITDLKRS